MLFKKDVGGKMCNVRTTNKKSIISLICYNFPQTFQLLTTTITYQRKVTFRLNRNTANHKKRLLVSTDMKTNLSLAVEYTELKK